MKQTFEGWEAVAERLQRRAETQQQLAINKGEDATWLNAGQRASLLALARRIVNNGVIIADEVGMGKTRIAVEVCRCVVESGGRAAILVPPGLGYQWQDELRQGGLQDVPTILRSLASYLRAWDDPTQPWFEKPAVMVSHAFTNWRFGEKSHEWRWVLVPEVYAHWRKLKEGRLPWGYQNSEILAKGWVCGDVARSVCASVPGCRKHPVRCLLDQLLELQWPSLLDPGQYSKWGKMRLWLERCIGFGLGVFDMVVVDEAHKSRRTDSGLSRLLANVIITADCARTLALTATPVELDVTQWKETLGRVRLSETALVPIQDVVNQYVEAVRRVRRSWRSCKDARSAYSQAAAQFRNALSPYLLRRDKREDPAVEMFARHSQLPVNTYRRETEVTVDPRNLTIAWRKAVCAAESLSVVTRQADDPVAKRLRLTLGNGHGVAALVDQIKRSDDDRMQEEYEGTCRDDGVIERPIDPADARRQARAEWWLNVLRPVFDRDGQALFDHPAILAAMGAIEEVTRAGEKVLVFGRFTRPLRALVDLINAREMLRRVEREQAWPQAKVHGDPHGNGEDSEWEAVRAAHRQLGSSVRLDTLDRTLRTRYERESHRRERFRERLISTINEGMEKIEDPGLALRRMLDAFRRSVQNVSRSQLSEHRSLALVSRALLEILEGPDGDASPHECARAFCELILAGSDRDDAEDEGEIDDIRAGELWGTIEDRLAEEYDRPQGGFARLMYGGTSPASRRMIQLAFNRRHSFPHVLVAQSLVGREGLNLHRACRTVVLLHPEWNPGVVEQQIGRVDRVDSHWCNELRKAIEKGTPTESLPRIEVRPVIFRGTYDEHNWEVLRRRWDELRAQLHGVVITSSDCTADAESKALIDEICAFAPNFSPTPRQE
jgi:superfamily II DNA or RNA helicase